MCQSRFNYKNKPTLDRIDNAKAHTKANVLPCCLYCYKYASNKDKNEARLMIQLRRFALKNGLPMTISDQEVYQLCRREMTGGISYVAHRQNIACETKINKFIYDRDSNTVHSFDLPHVMTHVYSLDFNSLYASVMSSEQHQSIPYANHRLYIPGYVLERIDNDQQRMRNIIYNEYRFSTDEQVINNHIQLFIAEYLPKNDESQDVYDEKKINGLTVQSEGSACIALAAKLENTSLIQKNGIISRITQNKIGISSINTKAIALSVLSDQDELEAKLKSINNSQLQQIIDRDYEHWNIWSLDETNVQIFFNSGKLSVTFKSSKLNFRKGHGRRISQTLTLCVSAAWRYFPATYNAHSTHQCQSLDYCPFSTFKNVLKKYCMSPPFHATAAQQKQAIVTAFSEAVRQAAAEDIIKKGFQRSIEWPFNLSTVSFQIL
ncbi:MAG: hypothetical protein EZS28_014581 [Streblomastix strix]|uniref:Uncharacterized protein n=1 Tax=Streblomastix strix TaxID=222440 RepID=A0A5J4W4M1_9EUKA|nr:MAG: hypothetical protein EZS28_014581 [Streblomastix strix]